MAVFEKVELEWGGKEYTIPPDQVMGAIAVIEEHLTLSQVLFYKSRSDVPVSRLIGAYAAVLRYAGAKVTTEEIYATLFGKDADAKLIQRALDGILVICIPPEAMREAEREAEAAIVESELSELNAGKSEAAAQKDSSKKRTK